MISRVKSFGLVNANMREHRIDSWKKICWSFLLLSPVLSISVGKYLTDFVKPDPNLWRPLACHCNVIYVYISACQCNLILVIMNIITKAIIIVKSATVTNMPLLQQNKWAWVTNRVQGRKAWFHQNWYFHQQKTEMEPSMGSFHTCQTWSAVALSKLHFEFMSMALC